MSILLMDLALRAQGLEPVEKLVLTQIANHADADGDSWCYIAELEDVTGRNDRTVRRALRSLEAAGLIVTNIRKAAVKSSIPSHLRPNAYRVIEVALREIQPAKKDRSPVSNTPPERPVTDDPSLGETGHPRPHRPVTHDRSRPVTHDRTESSTEPSTESSLSSEHNSTSAPPDETDDDDEISTAITQLVAAKLVHRTHTDGRAPTRRYGMTCAHNLRPDGPDHDQVLDVLALRSDRPELDWQTAANIVLGHATDPDDLAPTAPVLSIEERNARSHVAALVMTGAIDEARGWIDTDCPPSARDAARLELDRRTGARSAS
jgi:DNA-binding MarR family transcriptional regulator